MQVLAQNLTIQVHEAASAGIVNRSESAEALRAATPTVAIATAAGAVVVVVGARDDQINVTHSRASVTDLPAVSGLVVTGRRWLEGMAGRSAEEGCPYCLVWGCGKGRYHWGGGPYCLVCGCGKGQYHWGVSRVLNDPDAWHGIIVQCIFTDHASIALCLHG